MRLCNAFLLPVLALMIPACLFAVDLPLLLRWNSANTFSYVPDQPGKDIAFSEFYRLDICIDSLRYRDLYMDLDIRSKANFINTYLEVHQANITFDAAPLDFGASIKASGYAMSAQLHPAPIIHPDLDAYHFLPTRFNGIFVEYPSRITLKFEAGGNFHNLASGRLSERLPLLGSLGSLTFIQEIQTFDSHWHQPVIIGAAEFMYDSPGLDISSTAVAAIYPEYKTNPAELSPFFHVETRKSLSSGWSFYLQGIYEEPNPDRSSRISMDAALAKQISPFILAAGSTLDYFQHGNQTSPYTVLKWIPAVGQHLGLAYRCIISDSGSTLHEASLQAELSFGI